MLISSYNRPGMGDVLVTITAPDQGQTQVTQKQDVVQLRDAAGQVTGYNFLQASRLLPELSTVQGPVTLTADQVSRLNQAVMAAGFDQELVADPNPKFVIGYVKELKAHPKSDHLHIAQVDLGDTTVQIVSGSPNIANHIKVVVAKVGAMMPSGAIIWPGSLVGVQSDGMICSGRELRLHHAPDRPGALILPDDFGQPGEAFDFARGNHLFD